MQMLACLANVQIKMLIEPHKKMVFNHLHYYVSCKSV